MPQFIDSKQRTWRIEINGGLARRLKQEEQLDFFNAWDGKAFAALAQSEEKLIDALWLCCEEQAQRQSIDPIEFAYGFAGGDVFDQSAQALIEGVILFTPPAKRPAIEAVVKRTHQALAAGVTAAVKKLEGPQGDELLAAGTRKAEAEFDRMVSQATANSFSTSSPASLASTPSG